MEGILSPEQVLSGPASQRAYDCDAYTVDRSKPTAIVLPETTDEVAKVVRWCVANDVPFTGRGAGTGLSGGALPALGGVVGLHQAHEPHLGDRRAQPTTPCPGWNREQAHL